MLRIERLFMRRRLILFTLVAGSVVWASNEDAARKLLMAKYWACHSQMALGGLRLDSREAMLRGGKSGPAVAPKNASGSRLYLAVAHTDPAVKPMPPGAPLTAEELRTLESWINEGA